MIKNLTNEKVLAENEGFSLNGLHVNLDLIRTVAGYSQQPTGIEEMKMLVNRSVSGVYCSDDPICTKLTAIRGVKTTGLLVVNGQCTGRFDSAGVVRGEHQIIITSDHSTFLSYIEMYALKGTKVVFLGTDDESETSYRVGV